METLPDSETALQRDQARVVAYFRAAFGEIAAALGGDALVAEVTGLPANIGSGWPANALQFLEERHPGAAEAVFSRAEAIQDEVHASETAAIAAV